MQDKSSKPTKFNKCKNRSPTPIPSPLVTFPTFNDTEDPDDTASEVSIAIHSQDEDDFSTDYNAISTPRNYHIPVTPPKTHKAMLSRPFTRNIKPLAQETKPVVIPADTQLQPTCESPLLPTPPAPTRQHIKSTIPRPPTFNNSRKPTFPRPSMLNNDRFHQQPYIPRPHTPRLNNQ